MEMSEKISGQHKSNKMQDDGKGGEGGLVPEANGTEPSPGPSGLTEGPKWQRPRITRSSFMKCCLVKWIIDSTTPQGPG